MTKELFEYQVKLFPLAELTRSFLNAVYLEKIDLERKSAQEKINTLTKISDIRRVEKMKIFNIGKLESELFQYDRMFRKLVDSYKDREEFSDLIELTSDIFNVFWNKAIRVENWNIRIDTDEPVYLKSIKEYSEKYGYNNIDVEKDVEDGCLETVIVNGETKIID